MSSTVDASVTTPGDHVVLFYEQDRFLSDCIAGYVRQGLAEDRDVLVVATAPHQRSLDDRLDRSAHQADSGARLTTLDALDTLDSLLVDGALDIGRFHARIVPWLVAANESGRAPRIYGEMVALLWSDGRSEAALELEALWNRVGESYPFSMLCGYPMRGFGDHDSAAGFVDVCRQHTAVTTESYARLLGERDGGDPMVVLNGGSPGGSLGPG